MTVYVVLIPLLLTPSTKESAFIPGFNSVDQNRQVEIQRVIIDTEVDIKIEKDGYIYRSYRPASEKTAPLNAWILR